MDDNNDPYPQLGSVYRKGSCLGQVNLLRENVPNIAVKSAQNGKIAPNGRDAYFSTPSAWDHPNLLHKLGVHRNDKAKTTKIADLKNFSSNVNKTFFQQNSYNNEQRSQYSDLKCQVGVADYDKIQFVNNECEDEELFGSSDEDDLLNDNSDADTSKKRNKRFKAFFSDMDKLTVEEINSSARKWHCPACKGGPGAIDWYRGLEPLLYHSMTIKTRRAQLHRLFAEILEVEAWRRGILITPRSVASGRWEGLNERAADLQIVWPPMVVIMNTRCEQEDNGKWIGMGNQELLDRFKSFAALKARHAYGPQGHRGISVLIFDDSAAGYLEADCLHKHFKKEGRGRDAWNSSRVPFCSGGRRQLYGFMALKEDLILFNHHSHGRLKLKFEIRSYQEMVDEKIKEMHDNKQELIQCKDKIVKGEKHTQVLAESIIRLSQELHRSLVNRHSMRQQTKLLLEAHKEELDRQEQFFNEQLKVMYQVIEGKEDNFEHLQQPIAYLFNKEDSNRMENVGSLKNIDEEKRKEFEGEWKDLLKNQLEKEALVMKKCWEDLLELEKGFGNELSELREKYIKNSPQNSETTNTHSTV